MQTNTHAYLMMVHNEPKALELLMELLDDERNSIYIHVDQRSSSIDKSWLKEQCKHAKVTLIDSEMVYWSGYSQIRVTLRLIKKALEDNHAYYHLISGADLPLRTQDEIHDFFKANDGLEFVSYGKVERWMIACRYKYYHFEKLVDVIGRNRYRVFRVLSGALQKLLFIDRTRNSNLEFHFGGQWFSITHQFATYIIENESFIAKTFGRGFCADEIVIATLLMNSPFKKNSTEAMNMRMVDWTRGNPYTWQDGDFDELINSDLIFARKFSYNQHPEIMEQIKQHLLTKTNNNTAGK